MIVGYNFVIQTYNTLLLPIKMDLTNTSNTLECTTNSQLLTHYFFDIEDNVGTVLLLSTSCVPHVPFLYVNITTTKLVCMNGTITIHLFNFTPDYKRHFVTICSILMWFNAMVMSLSHPTLETKISCIGFINTDCTECICIARKSAN